MEAAWIILFLSNFCSIFREMYFAGVSVQLARCLLFVCDWQCVVQLLVRSWCVCLCVRRLCCFALLWHLILSDNAAMAIMMLIAVTTHANEPCLNNYKNDLWCRFVFPTSPSWTSDKRHFWERRSRGVFFFFFPLLPGSLVLFTMISHSLLQCYLNESQHLCVLLSIKITGGMSGERP